MSAIKTSLHSTTTQNIVRIVKNMRKKQRITAVEAEARKVGLTYGKHMRLKGG